MQLDGSNEGSVTNGAGGKIVATGSGDVLMEPGTTFTEGAGTTSGTKPVILRDAALVYTGAGASAIAHARRREHAQRQPRLRAVAVGREHQRRERDATAGGGLHQRGLDHADQRRRRGNNATLAITAGTLTNSGTITSEPAERRQPHAARAASRTPANCDQRQHVLQRAKAPLTNEGTLNVAEGKTLKVSGEGAFTNGAGGSIVAGGKRRRVDGTGYDVHRGRGHDERHQAGDRQGRVRWRTRARARARSPMHGEVSTLSGNVSAGQALSIESTSGENAHTTAAVGFTNAGAITLTNGETPRQQRRGSRSLAGRSRTAARSTSNRPTAARARCRAPSRTRARSRSTRTPPTAARNTCSRTRARSDIAEGKQLTVSGENSVSNVTGGKIIATGSGLVQLEQAARSPRAAGTTSGSKAGRGPRRLA